MARDAPRRKKLRANWSRPRKQSARPSSQSPGLLSGQPLVRLPAVFLESGDGHHHIHTHAHAVLLCADVHRHRDSEIRSPSAANSSTTTCAFPGPRTLIAHHRLTSLAPDRRAQLMLTSDSRPRPKTCVPPSRTRSPLRRRQPCRGNRVPQEHLAVVPLQRLLRWAQQCEARPQPSLSRRRPHRLFPQSPRRRRPVDSPERKRLSYSADLMIPVIRPLEKRKKIHSQILRCLRFSLRSRHHEQACSRNRGQRHSLGQNGKQEGHQPIYLPSWSPMQTKHTRSRAHMGGRRRASWIPPLSGAKECRTMCRNWTALRRPRRLARRPQRRSLTMPL